MFAWLARQFIKRVCVRKNEYRKGHLTHADGSLYMGRWGLFETTWLSARVHYIASDDYDRALHDHPWAFVSLVLSGGYEEIRPEVNDENNWMPQSDGSLVEVWHSSWRGAGSIAYRRPTDRHMVVGVRPGTYTLFFYGRARQWWGFYTRTGKVFWQDFGGMHIALSTKRGERGSD